MQRMIRTEPLDYYYHCYQTFHACNHTTGDTKQTEKCITVVKPAAR